MNRKVLRSFSVIVLVSTIITGCSNSFEIEKDTLQKEIVELKDKNISLEKTVAELQNKIIMQETEINEVTEAAFQNKANMYPIYTSNTFKHEKEVNGYIYIDNKISLEQKLNILTKVLSEVYFDNLPIQVVKIEEVDKKKIAVVNLSESKENLQISDLHNYKGKSWANLYFQGSSGGQSTTTQLIETLLQREYKGQWIDGVSFLYNNDIVDKEHVPELKNINYRKK